LFLFHGVAPGFFANKHSPGFGSCFVKQGGVDQAIKDHDISRAKAAQTLECEQFRVTGTCTNQVNSAM
jgi:hypothetical protein